MQYFWTFQLGLALLAGVIDRRLARRRMADGAGREGATLSLDANQRSICAVSFLPLVCSLPGGFLP